MKKWNLAKRLWGIYLDACICSMDYGSSCDCNAQWEIGELLKDLLGKKWHDKCRRRFA